MRARSSRGKRLGDVVVRPALKPRDLVALFRPRREHDDGKLTGLAVALEGTRQLQAAHVREHPVDQDEVGTRVGEGRACTAAILGLAHLEAGTLETEGDHLADRSLVLDDQYLFRGCHGVLQLVGAAIREALCCRFMTGTEPFVPPGPPPRQTRVAPHHRAGRPESPVPGCAGARPGLRLPRASPPPRPGAGTRPKPCPRPRRVSWPARGTL